MTPIAAKIKAHRAALKMTQAQYGAALDEPVSGQTISCWERGQWTPTTRHLISLSKLMGSPTEQPSLDDYASATTDQLMADAVSAATLPSDALAMSAELTRRHQEYVKPAHYDDPIVRKIVTMTDDGNGYFSPHLASFEALGFCAREIPQAINHIQAPPNGVWRWPSHKSNLIALANELKGQLHMRWMGCSPWGDRVKIDLNIARMDAVITRLKLNDILTDSDTVQESPDDMTHITTQAPNPQAITIDWQALVGTHQGVSGVSLRHLVSLGLYGDYRRAAEALEREPLFDTMSKSVSLPSTGGRPAEDIIITDLRAVQRFCARARTEMGGRILEVVLDHHDELQAMLAGDAAALARHEQAKAPRPIDALDVMGAMLEQMRIQRDALAAQEARQLELESRTAEVVAQVGQLERRLETTPLAGELSAYDVAVAAKVTAKSGKPHAMAVLELVYQMGLPQEGLARQVWGEVNGKLAPSWLIHQDGADMIKRELALMAKGGKIVNGALCFTLKGRKRTYTVYR